MSSTAIVPYQERPNALTPLATPSPEQLKKMEETQSKVAPYIPTNEETSTTQLSIIPSEIQQERERILDKIGMTLEQIPLSLRLSALISRIAEASEHHMHTHRIVEMQKKDETAERVRDQKTNKGYQAAAQVVGGFGSSGIALLGIFGFFNQTFLNALTQLTPQGANAIVTLLQANTGPNDYAIQDYLARFPGDKQAVEGLMQLPSQLRNLILELLRSELRVFESIGR